MALGAQSVIDNLVSLALASGLFRAVNGHEPKSAPEAGLTCAVWADTVDPVRESGLAVSSARVVFKLRLYTPMISEPQDAIDPTLLAAADVVLAAIHADLELGGTVRNIDVFGANGVALGARAGYVTIGSTVFRVIDVTVPAIINDVWNQET